MSTALPFHPLIAFWYHSIAVNMVYRTGEDRSGRWNNSPKELNVACNFYKIPPFTCCKILKRKF